MSECSFVPVKDHIITGYQYSRCCHFLWKLKVVHGNDFLNVTLRNHPIIKNALLAYEKEHIIELEREFKDSIS